MVNPLFQHDPFSSELRILQLITDLQNAMIDVSSVSGVQQKCIRERIGLLRGSTRSGLENEYGAKENAATEISIERPR